MSDTEHEQPVVSAPARERKFIACRRLAKEGRYAAFRARVAYFHSPAGQRLGRNEAFYAALAEFPPPEKHV